MGRPDLLHHKLTFRLRVPLNLLVFSFNVNLMAPAASRRHQVTVQKFEGPVEEVAGGATRNYVGVMSNHS